MPKVSFFPNNNIVNDTVAEILVCTVNCEGVMGKGVAKAFATKWPSIKYPYQAACKNYSLVPGSCRIFEIPGTTETLFDTKPARLWAAFATKNHWANPSRLSWVESGLRELAYECKARFIETIALPPPGCGNGGLDWNDVRPLVLKHLAKFDLRIYGVPD